MKTVIWRLALCLVGLWTGFDGSLRADLPLEVQKIITKSEPQFIKVLTGLPAQQGKWLLDKYVVLLLESPLVSPMKVDRQELQGELVRRFGHLNRAFESPEKKNRTTSPFSEEMDKELEKIAKSLKGDFKGSYLDLNVRCSQGAGLLRFELVEGENENEVSLKLPGVSVPRDSENDIESESFCFEMTLEVKNPVVDLDWIGTSKTACALPISGAGNCVLDIAEQIAKAAARKKIQLIDESDILCPLNGKSASLRRLRYFTEGKTWYEKYGYKVLGKEAAYRTKLTQMEAYPLESVLDKLVYVQDSKETVATKALLKELARDFLAKQPNATAVQFMSALWKMDCAKYIQIDDMLSEIEYDVEFYGLIPEGSFFEKDIK